MQITGPIQYYSESARLTRANFFIIIFTQKLYNNVWGLTKYHIDAA